MEPHPDKTGTTSRSYRLKNEKEAKNGQGGAWYKHQAGEKPEKRLDSYSIQESANIRIIQKGMVNAWAAIVLVVRLYSVATRQW